MPEEDYPQLEHPPVLMPTEVCNGLFILGVQDRLEAMCKLMFTEEMNEEINKNLGVLREERIKTMCDQGMAQVLHPEGESPN